MHTPLRRLAIVLSACVVAVSWLGGCSAAPADVSAVTAAASAPASGATLDAEEFAAAIKRPGVTILDVRTPVEFAAGHLPGAVNIDVNGAGFDAAITALPADGEYAVYCRSGNRSATALATMKDLGRATAYHLGGGIGAWQSAGGALVTG